VAEVSRAEFFKRAGQITLASVTTGALVTGPALLELEDAEAEAARVTSNGRRVWREAKKWLGTPYKHNGRSRHGIDCSMLIKRVYGAALGIYVPDDPGAIWYKGRRRRGRRIYVGDICCYKENGPRGPITHVSIQGYNSEIIHASTYWREVAQSAKKWPGCGYIGNAVWR
jgi:cell wall-associated NlpC family hydrolase